MTYLAACGFGLTPSREQKLDCLRVLLAAGADHAKVVSDRLSATTALAAATCTYGSNSKFATLLAAPDPATAARAELSQDLLLELGPMAGRGRCAGQAAV